MQFIIYTTEYICKNFNNNLLNICQPALLSNTIYTMPDIYAQIYIY